MTQFFGQIPRNLTQSVRGGCLSCLFSTSPIFVTKDVPCFVLWKRDVNPALKSSPYGGVQSPWKVCGPEDQDSRLIMTESLHLYEKLCLHPSGGLILAVRPTAAHRINLIDKYNRRLFLSRAREQSFYQFFTLPHVFTHQIRRRHRKECTLCLRGTSLRQKSFAGTRGTVKKYSFPRLTTSCENFFESNGQNDCLLQCIFCFFKTGDVLPPDIGLFCDDSIANLSLEAVVLLVTLATAPTASHVMSFINQKLPTSFPYSLFLSLPFSYFILSSYDSLTAYIDSFCMINYNKDIAFLSWTRPVWAEGYFLHVSRRSRAAKNDGGCGSTPFFAQMCQRGRKTVNCLRYRA